MSTNGAVEAVVQVENGAKDKDSTVEAVAPEAAIGKTPPKDAVDGDSKEEAPAVGDLIISGGEEKANAETTVTAENGKIEELAAAAVEKPEQNGHSEKKEEKMDVKEADAGNDGIEIVEVEVENPLKRKSEGGAEEVGPPKVALVEKQETAPAAGEEA